MLRTALETVRGRVPVISGLAETSTARAAAYAREAEKLGVDGLMVFPGLTYKSDARETIAFYRSVAQASRLEILLYNNPRGYGVDLTPDVVAELLESPTITAIKEESYDTTRVTDLVSRFGDRLAVVCGVDDLIVESAALGARAWVSGMANAPPRESVRLLELAVPATSAGDFAQARKLYAALTPLFHLDTGSSWSAHQAGRAPDHRLGRDRDRRAWIWPARNATHLIVESAALGARAWVSAHGQAPAQGISATPGTGRGRRLRAGAQALRRADAALSPGPWSSWCSTSSWPST